MTTLAAAVQGASGGRLLDVELLPLDGSGKLRAGPWGWENTAPDHWTELPGSVFCDPTDSSPFVWALAKVDATHVTLTPPAHGPNGLGPAGLTMVSGSNELVIGSVDDQPPLGLTSYGMLTASFTWLDQTVQVRPLDGDPHPRLVYDQPGADPAPRIFFLAVQGLLQPQLQVPLAPDLTPQHIEAEVAACGIADPGAAATQIAAQLKITTNDGRTA